MIKLGYMLEASNDNLEHKYSGLTIFEARALYEELKDSHDVRVYYVPYDLPDISGELYGRY